ncbi:MAG TPA: carboxypeptidase regulatory-like domain-containing protein [Bryobacteraceae bacterium]|nr:carboxypeptidase regulatory-like domain-containing protein [Bryobacteraceae bacterium]
MAAVCISAKGATVSGRAQLSGAKDHTGVVVWLEPIGAKPPETAPQTVSMAHLHKTFVPHAVALRIGSKVRFPNQDPFFHNAFSNYDGEMFDVGLHPPGSAREITFHRPGVVRVFCNIHPTMSAVIVVLDTPWFAITNAQGAFRVPDLPPGEYRLKVFYERALPETLEKLDRQIRIGPEDLSLPDLEVSEAGYVVPPHKNKFGKDYPAVIVDQYPGGRR